MSDYKIQSIELQHIKEIIDLDVHATSTAPEEIRYADFLTAILKLHSRLAFGMWHGNELVGAAFGMTLGKIGGFVHCCVHPEHQRRGIGSALAEAVTTNVLARAEVCIVQLPITAQWEIGWLTSCGYQCVEPQLILKKAIAEVTKIDAGSVAVTTQWQDNLELREHGIAMQSAGLGQLVQVGTAEACVGMLFVETAPRRHAASQTAAVSFGSVRRSLSGDSLMTGLRMAESVAHESGKRQLVVALNSIYHRELELLLKAGWTIAKTSHRMVHKKSFSRYRQIQSLPHVDISHWSL